MTRRLTLLIVATVAATLLLAGVGTFALARLSEINRTKKELSSQATTIASTIDQVDSTGAVRVLNNLRTALHLEGIQVMRFGPAGRTVDPYPDGVKPSDVDLTKLRNGEDLSGHHGTLVYAIAPAQVSVVRSGGREPILVAVVLTRQSASPLQPAWGWFFIASIITLALGALVAWRFGRRLTRPLRDAEEATRRIAAGDLSARVPVHTGGHDELASLGASINTMAETLERSKGLERQFLLSVSHDLRTPLTSIRGYAEAIADGALPEPSDGASVILAESRRLERLVGDLLDLAKLESRQFALGSEPVDLAEVAAGTADGFLPEAEDAGVTIGVAAPPGGLVVLGDADRLAQVAANLVQNALKFARSRIELRASLENGWARLDVLDDGPGIADEDLPHVFERLYVSRHQPQRKEAGSGLGLAIVRELVTAMHGHVRASAATGDLDGACLSVFLPPAPVSSSSTAPTNGSTSSTTPTSSTASPSSESG